MIHVDTILFPVRGIQIASLLMVLYGLYTALKMYKKSNGWRPYLISVIVLLVHESVYFISILSYLIINSFFSRVPDIFTDWSVGLRFHELFVVVLFLAGIKKRWDRR